WLADVLTDVIGDGTAYGVSLTWRIEDEPLGTAGGVIAARDILDDGDEPILVLSGDGIHDIDLAAVERTHRASGALVTLALLPVVDPSEYGVAVLDGSGRITGFQEKPKAGTERSRLANTGVYVVSPRALDLCVEWGLTDFGSELFPRMLDEGFHIHGHELVDTYWNDIGDLDEWRASNHAVLTGAVKVGGADLDDMWGPWSEGVYVHPTADVDPSAKIEAPAVIGAGARIGADAQLRSVVVLPYAEIAANQVVASGTVGSLTGLQQWIADLRSDVASIA
ncbi:MAG: putative mannose-phosphate guanyltransferase, partial [Thermoleophilia bacterium]|nr:putative mannose-phosphate guanyltransferase [Thermoleophilia bacterium]